MRLQRMIILEKKVVATTTTTKEITITAIYLLSFDL